MSIWHWKRFPWWFLSVASWTEGSLAFVKHKSLHSCTPWLIVKGGAKIKALTNGAKNRFISLSPAHWPAGVFIVVDINQKEVMISLSLTYLLLFCQIAICKCSWWCHGLKMCHSWSKMQNLPKLFAANRGKSFLYNSLKARPKRGRQIWTISMEVCI